MDSDATGAPAKNRPFGRILFGVVAVVALVALGRQFGSLLDQFVVWVEGLGAIGPLVFMFGYAAATVAFVPGAVLSLAAGATFGLGPGVLYVMLGATTGASLAFLLARYVAREAIEQRIQGNARFAAVDRAIGREGFKIVMLLRLSPVFPFNLLNYSLGLTKVRFADYVAASIGMLPGSLLYTWSGVVVGDVIRLAGRRRTGARTGLLHGGRPRSGRHHRGDGARYPHRAPGSGRGHGGITHRAVARRIPAG